MLEFSVLTSILTVYGKVTGTMLKHETILNNYLLENNISENNILFGIMLYCKITGIQRYNKKTQICYNGSSPRLPHSYLFILSDASLLLGNALMFCKTLHFLLICFTL